MQGRREGIEPEHERGIKGRKREREGGRRRRKSPPCVYIRSSVDKRRRRWRIYSSS